MEQKRWIKFYPEKVNPNIKKSKLVSLYQMLENSEMSYGDRIAIVSDEDEKITYTGLKEKVDLLASAWKDKGLHKGERIGLMLPNTPYYIIAYYAAMKLGLIVVQINPNYTMRELLEIIRDSAISYLVVDEYNAENGRQVIEMNLLVDLYVTESKSRQDKSISGLIHQSKSLTPEALIDIEEDAAVIQYTGGTTGGIKGAMLTHANLVSNVLQSFEVYGNEMKFGSETVLTATPLYHVYAMTSGMNMGIYAASTNILIKHYHVDHALEKIKKYQPTYFPGVPRMYNDFVNHPDVEAYGLNCLKFCVSGSAPIPVELIKKFEKITGAIIAEGFGLSEASPSTHRNPPFGKRKVGSIGLPLPGTDCKVIDESGNELPSDEIGELIIKGPQIMKGYWRKEKETADSLKNGWLHTGDLARQDNEGYFFIVGRKKELIITNGFNVYPQEVESVLFEHPDIKESAVVGIKDEKRGELTKAFIVVNNDVTIDEDELIGHCYNNLTPYKVPKQFEVIDDLPRNNVGKVLKKKLKEMESKKKYCKSH